MPYKTIHLEFTGEIAMITRSAVRKKRNAISPEMIITELLSRFLTKSKRAPRGFCSLTGAGESVLLRHGSGRAQGAGVSNSPAEQREDADRIARLLPANLEFPEAHHRCRERTRDRRRLRYRHALRLHAGFAGSEVWISGKFASGFSPRSAYPFFSCAKSAKNAPASFF